MSRRDTAASSPPAVWAAFAKVGRWKSWALAAQFLLNLLLLAVAMRLVRTDPDVVVVAEDGKSTYVPRALASGALVRFLETEKQKPSDLTVVRFTRDFLDAFFAVNSSTLQPAFDRALSMMDAHLSSAVRKEYTDGKVLETYRLAQIRSQVAVDELFVLQKTDSLIHLRAKLSRTRSTLVDGTKASTDSIEVELVERIVPRTPQRPDGLELAELAVRRRESKAGAAPGAAPPPAAPAPSSPAVAPEAVSDAHLEVTP